jgi:hypothetical protein
LDLKRLTMNEIAKTPAVARILWELGYTAEEIEKFGETVRCPRCGQPFASFPTGWGWISHLKECRRG